MKAKYPGVYNDIDDADLGRRVKAKHPGVYDDFSDAPKRSASMELLGYEQSTSDPYGARTPEGYRRPGRGAAANFLTGMQQEGAGSIAPAALSGFEALGSAMVGDFGPAKEIGELALRGAGRLVMGGQPSLASSFVANEQAIERLHAERAARRRGNPIFESVARTQAELELEAGQDPSLSGRIARGAGRVTASAAPSVGVGIASGGSIPAMAAVGALQSLDRPENLPLNVGLNAAPIPVGKAVAPLVRRFRGARGGTRNTSPQVVRDTARIPAIAQADAPVTQRIPAIQSTPEFTRQAENALTADLPPQLRRYQVGDDLPVLESAPLKPYGVSPGKDRGPSPWRRGPSLEEMGYSVPAQPVAKPTFRERAGQFVGDVYHLPRAIMASADISAPFRQGAILSLPPSQWGRAAKAGVRMFQSFRTPQFKRIAAEINNHADAPVAKQSGLYLSTDRGGALRRAEEDFISRWSDRIPIVKQSNQAYSAYLDSLRMDTFAKYKRVIDRSVDLSDADKATAYRAAAQWINAASGRGSLGLTADKAMPAMSYIFFAPRYVASRINVLDPRAYLRNASTPAGRAVLKQQMADLIQYAGVVSATMGLAKAAGADVSLDPRSSDFLKIRFGRSRYDLGAGLQQVMRLYYRVGDDAQRALRQQPATRGEGTLDVAGRFARSKLAPIPSYFTDMLSRRDYTGQPFSPGKAAIDRTTPLLWNDFVEAYMAEGGLEAAKVLPGAVGVGVQRYDEREKARRR